ncbi:MAG: universal stress protein [Gammaproteobacteria bacterium]|nr:universal stress protein [Gammaproteobacteria bacterium]
MALSKIMAVLDPTLNEQPAFERALDSAEITGAKLHLYMCVNESYGDGDKENIVSKYHSTLEDLATRARAQSVETEFEIDWHDNWRDQAAVASKRCGADLLIKHSVDHTAVDRIKRITADWTLLRKTTCPVLMIKDHTRWDDRRVLAAVVDKPVDAAHTKLNEQVVAFANDFAQSHQSDAHFVVGYHNRNYVPNAAEIAQRCSVGQEKVHVVHGQPDEVIASTAREIKADLIVIGTVARKGIKATVVGNTSERLLDHTHCDVLVLH